MYEIFEQLLRTNDVTAYRVSKATGISTGSLTDWKMGRSTPKRDKLKKIAEYFNVSVEYLLGEETEYQPDESDIKYLKAVIKKIPFASIKFLSYLCKNKRINDDLTEKYVSQHSNVPLFMYLKFENESQFIGYEYILKIMHFLRFQTSYTLGFMAGIIIMLEADNSDPDIDLAFSIKLDSDQMKEKFLSTAIHDFEALEDIFDKEESLCIKEYIQEMDNDKN